MLVSIPRSFARVPQASDRARSDHFLGHAFGMFGERKSIEDGEQNLKNGKGACANENSSAQTYNP